MFKFVIVIFITVGVLEHEMHAKFLITPIKPKTLILADKEVNMKMNFCIKDLDYMCFSCVNWKNYHEV